MYRVKLTGNYNVCISDLDTILTAARPEKSFPDSEFENSEDVKKYIGKFLSVEYVEVKATKPSKTDKKPSPAAPTEVKTKVEAHNEKERIVIENKPSQNPEVIIADNASIDSGEKLPIENEIVRADGASSEKKEAQEETTGPKVDNFGNVVQDVQIKDKKEEQPKIEAEAEVKVEEKTEEVKLPKKSKKKAQKADKA